MASTQNPSIISNNTKYKPLELTYDVVYDMARHYYSRTEIADRFNISDKTLMVKFGEAFQAGRDNAFKKPRILLAKIFRDFEESDVNFANPTTPVNTLLKAIELHARLYQGFGQTTTLITKSEKPSVSEITFEPLRGIE